MKFNFKPKKYNLYLMIFMIVLLLITCAIWFHLKEYVYFGVFLVLSIAIIHIYFNTLYIIDDKYLITKLGFLKIKIKYNNIKKVEEINQKVNIVLNNFTLDVSPENRDVFIKEINKKVGK